MTDWRIYRGDGNPDPARIGRLPPPPPWRRLQDLARVRAETFQPPPEAVEVVNAALYLRRPLLVTGDPGLGKSSLVYAVARELGLGSVLAWRINSRSLLQDGLYLYDAVGRLREASLERQRPGRKAGSRLSEDIGRFLSLGPLGTAFLAADRPRAVLIDEIDKSDVDLPNDLLHVFEDGEFLIPELARIADAQPRVPVGSGDPDRPGERVEIVDGRVRCGVFPLVVITSNGERDLPPAFLRRCLRLDLKSPTVGELRRIVLAHLGDGDRQALEALLEEFDRRRREGAMLATDQLLNAFYLVTRGRGLAEADWQRVREVLLRELDSR